MAAPTVPLLPITSTFALPLAFYHIFLQIRVTFRRMATGTNLAPTSSTQAKDKAETGNDTLLPAFRAQGNFTENVPLALLLASIVELNGGSQVGLAMMLGALVVFRVAHAEFGLMVPGSGGIGRPIGFFGTMGVVIVLAGYAAWLGRGSWGH